MCCELRWLVESWDGLRMYMVRYEYGCEVVWRRWGFWCPGWRAWHPRPGDSNQKMNSESSWAQERFWWCPKRCDAIPCIYVAIASVKLATIGTVCAAFDHLRVHHALALTRHAQSQSVSYFFPKHAWMNHVGLLDKGMCTCNDSSVWFVAAKHANTVSNGTCQPCVTEFFYNFTVVVQLLQLCSHCTAVFKKADVWKWNTCCVCRLARSISIHLLMHAPGVRRYNVVCWLWCLQESNLQSATRQHPLYGGPWLHSPTRSFVLMMASSRFLDCLLQSEFSPGIDPGIQAQMHMHVRTLSINSPLASTASLVCSYEYLALFQSWPAIMNH